MTIEEFDLIIIGSGGAGLKAAITAAKNNKKTAIISKTLANNSHTTAAKGGINASLGNVEEDNWRWHAFDTIKGSDYLADEKAVEILCKNANDAVIDLEKIGTAFSRNENGQIAQRAYGGQTKNFGKNGLAYRACYSKDKTGQAILHSLINEAKKYNVHFFEEFFVFDLIMAENICQGCLAIDLNQGKITTFASNATIIATGGYSQIYQNSTSSLICTGDGNALALRAGFCLKDMEFIQFHPTGIKDQGFLISEAARGEGAHLLNGQNQRFMQNYDPKMMELSSRDIISRAIATEIEQGRGCGAEKDHINLDLRHLKPEILEKKLPGIVEIAKKFAKIDVKIDPIPIKPTAHYTMGGIATNINCQLLDCNQNPAPNLFAIGEASCISVHGANRLGCNSLLDLIVFGQIAGENASKINNHKQKPQKTNERLQKILQKTSKNSKPLPEIKSQLQSATEKHLGVFRNQKSMQNGLEKILKLQNDLQNYQFQNKSLFFNNEITDYFEIESLILNSIASFHSALQRKESRGAHFTQDFPQKDDQNWQKHSIIYLKNNKIHYQSIKKS